MTNPLVEVSREGSLARVALNRAEARNALNPELAQALARALAQADDDAAVSAILLSGHGPHFCAGIDLKAAWPTELPVLVSAGMPDRDLPFAVRKPLIAAVQGVAIGAGFELALAADLILMGDDARMGLPEYGFGALPVTPALDRLVARAGAGLAADLLLTGRMLGAGEAAERGVATAAVPAADLMARALEVARTVAAQPPHVAILAKQLLADAVGGRSHPLAQSVAFAAFAQIRR